MRMRAAAACATAALAVAASAPSARAGAVISAENVSITTDSGDNATLRRVFGASAYFQSGKLCGGTHG